MNEIINYRLHKLKRIRALNNWDHFNYLKMENEFEKDYPYKN